MAGRMPGLAKVVGSGRQKGTVNRRTGQQLKAIATAAQAVGGDLTDDEISRMDALEVLSWAMRVAVKSNQLALAASCAEKLASYTHVKADKLAEDFFLKRTIADFSDHELEIVLRAGQAREIAFDVAPASVIADLERAGSHQARG